MEKSITYLCDVPRTITTVDAEDENAALEALKLVLDKVVTKFAAIEDITGKEIPSADAAMKEKTKSLLGEVVKVFSIGKKLSGMKKDGFYGIGNTDIILGKDLFNQLSDEKVDDDLISCKNYFKSGVGTTLFAQTAAVPVGVASEEEPDNSEDNNDDTDV